MAGPDQAFTDHNDSKSAVQRLRLITLFIGFIRYSLRLRQFKVLAVLAEAHRSKTTEAPHETGEATNQSLKHLHERVHIELTAIEHRTIQRDIRGNRHRRLNFFFSRTRRTGKSRMCRNAIHTLHRDRC